MTLMTLNLGYGIGISPKQRHQRHYRHARMLPGGLGHTPEMRLWISKRYASKTHLPQEGGTIKPDTHINSYMLQSESV